MKTSSFRSFLAQAAIVDTVNNFVVEWTLHCQVMFSYSRNANYVKPVKCSFNKDGLIIV